jgi:hypothetical protein
MADVTQDGDGHDSKKDARGHQALASCVSASADRSQTSLRGPLRPGPSPQGVDLCVRDRNMGHRYRCTEAMELLRQFRREDLW